MLVLSRKSSEEIVFPSLGVTIRVLRTSANTVKLGVEAPPHLKVLRGELSSCEDLIATVGGLAQNAETHELRNRLNSLVLKLELFKRVEQKGLSTDHWSIFEDVAKALAALDAELARQATPHGTCPARGRRLKFLVVDDDANERELLAAVLTLQGFDVRGAADGVEAIGELNSNLSLPDAVLLDLDMPRLSGESTLRCIRSDRRFQHLNVIGISGRPPHIDLLPDNQRGFDAMFAKPLQLQQLLEIVSRPRRETPVDSLINLAP